MLLSGHLVFCWYGSAWQLPIVMATSFLVVGAFNGSVLWRSKQGRSKQSLREKYVKYKGYLAHAQNQMGKLASVIERLLNLWHWQEARACTIFAVLVMAVACVTSLVVLLVELASVRVVGVVLGLLVMRPPFLRWTPSEQEHLVPSPRNQSV